MMRKNEKCAIGIDLGGTFVKFGIVNQSGKILKKIILESKADKGTTSVVKQIKKGINELLSDEGFKIQGIGIGAPGIVSLKKGTVEHPPNFPGWGIIHLGNIIKKEFGIKTFVENDANAAAIGELMFGMGKYLKSFVMITLGTGVGGGIILNKKIYRGEFGAAGEIGHISIDVNGAKCNCGSYGCIEAYAGNNYLINRVKNKLNDNPESKLFELFAKNSEPLTPKIISEAAEKGDKFAISIIEELGTNVGYAMASVSNLLDVSTIIVGGGVSAFGKTLLDNIHAAMKERVLLSMKGRVKILPAKLKNEAGIKGASSLVFYSH
ncbi:MAG: ROK family protein [Chlorobiaceae bacterium]|nr:ROK family protein [Chlorobiaceae bacterium]MBA4309752.1 ROK family protein [Chlorobiaceae bacterium]